MIFRSCIRRFFKLSSVLPSLFIPLPRYPPHPSAFSLLRPHYHLPLLPSVHHSSNPLLSSSSIPFLLPTFPPTHSSSRSSLHPQALMSSSLLYLPLFFAPHLLPAPRLPRLQRVTLSPLAFSFFFFLLKSGHQCLSGSCSSRRLW